MKKLLFVITFTICFSLFIIPVYAAEWANNYGYTINKVDDSHYQYNLYYYNFSYYDDPSINYFHYCDTMGQGMASSYQDAINSLQNIYNNYQPVSNYRVNGGGPTLQYQNSTTCYIYNMPYETVPSGVTVITINAPFDPREPAAPFDPPEPGTDWFDNMWDYFTDLLGLTDDFSDELKGWVFDIGDGTGGHSGGHSFEIVTPSPTQSPTPFPSPTPYDLTINYSDGTTGTITGIPGNTTIINGGDTTNNYGSDFDIFEVDLKIGDGGSVNPRDGLNSVMDSNQEYLQDIDTSPITASFSIIPNDWFLLIGVLGAIPFIAGFISKLLK